MTRKTGSYICRPLLIGYTRYLQPQNGLGYKIGFRIPVFKVRRRAAGAAERAAARAEAEGGSALGILSSPSRVKREIFS